LQLAEYIRSCARRGHPSAVSQQWRQCQSWSVPASSILLLLATSWPSHTQQVVV